VTLPSNSSFATDIMEASNQSTESSTPKTTKDKKCPFCLQAFTSSSLGRHLDLYIKEKNPKPPDGLHDVDQIRKLRGNITRRQPKGSVPRRDTSMSVGTPTAMSKRSPVPDDAESSATRSPMPQPESAQVIQATQAAQGGDITKREYPFNTPWEATGVINDISARDSDGGVAKEGEGAVGASTPTPSVHSVPPQRIVNRNMMKQQLEARQQVQDALDRARAAELALREMISSWRAAKFV
jgi:hypothetical protein